MRSAIILLLATISLRDIKSNGPPGKKKTSKNEYRILFFLSMLQYTWLNYQLASDDA